MLCILGMLKNQKTSGEGDWREESIVLSSTFPFFILNLIVSPVTSGMFSRFWALSKYSLNRPLLFFRMPGMKALNLSTSPVPSHVSRAVLQFSFSFSNVVLLLPSRLSHMIFSLTLQLITTHLSELNSNVTFSPQGSCP